jgi:hypothetical protein
MKKMRGAFTTENLVEAAGAGGLALIPDPTMTSFALAAGGTVVLKALTNLAKPSQGTGPLRYVFSMHKELN